ncbi:cAMP-inducible prespore protein D7-like [Mercenaria mercenaria]|uniref:cAMP-inducible prespore protein D7-like n=1 Tax=Mercenaria mercenaria TaxID=6596 RepID=UPI00234F9EE6|nr:cAMP-inducible prespore protein D7-like [Mercenaria mercenaria]
MTGDRVERMVSARAPWREELPRHEETMDSTEEGQEENRPSTPADAVQMAVKKASDSKSGNVDMETLEKELVRIAPTIADLFSKIHTQTTTVVGQSDEELKKIRDDNDRLRKTNRSLVEKLNSFQQKIIQLQLENKKLREISDNEKVKQTQLDEKSTELEKLKDKLIEQKRALEAKEKELDSQMNKLQNVIIDNEEQKFKLANLEQLHEEGLREYGEQQQQIEELQKDKEQQRAQIQALEDKQSMSEHIVIVWKSGLMLDNVGTTKKDEDKIWTGQVVDERED